MISVLNAEGTVQCSVEARHSFIGKQSDSWEMPKLMDRSDLLAENEKCSIDVLVLQVEFIVCENNNHSLPPKIERICAKIDIDTLDNIHDHKIAVKLYIAADKYQILQLKDICSNHLSSVASTTNVFDIMYLSFKYQDENLKSAVRKLISNDVLNSYRWENFMLEGLSARARDVKAPSVKEIDCTNLDETTSNAISPTGNARKRKISEKRKT
ncbi:hypothetical protein TNCV_271581 [Trichonephila clavipes]|nr:hypothetical protein TNCV_271581 [Trichonephila clavipes]